MYTSILLSGWTGQRGPGKGLRLALSAGDLQIWIDQAVSGLLAARNDDAGWGYAPLRASNTEATSLCALATSAHAGQAEAIAAAADWVALRGRPDGAFSISVDHPEASWVTPLAAMALARAAQAPGAVAAAAEYLLNAPVFLLSSPPAVYGYDTTIPGWPWTPGDFSFVEPTALAVIFLKQQGHFDHPRVREAVAMLRIRALPAGGWNYGEPVVLGSELFPAAAPTALALLALADEPDGGTDAGLDWLAGQQGKLTAFFSLGWAATAMNVYGRLDEPWTSDVVTAWNAAPASRQNAMDLALCLLGLSPRSGHPLAVGG